MNLLRIVLLDHVPTDPALRQAWNQLALQMEHPEVFYTWEWATAVQRAYREQVVPLVVLAYEGESLVGGAALGRKAGGEVVFLTADTGDYCDFLSGAQIRGAFVGAVLSALRSEKVTKAVFTNLPADSASAVVLSEACSNVGYHLHSRPAYDCARVVFASSEDRTAIKGALVSRKRFRRNIRELQKRGALTVEHQTDVTEIEALLPAFVRAHVARFLETGKFSSLIREERRAFLIELARELSASGWIAFSRLIVGEVTAAWNYGFRFAGSWFWYQPTVNDLFWDFSPGYCLLAKIVELACDSPQISIVDLGLGAEAYKDRFATTNRGTLYCELNNSLLGHTRAVARYRAAAIATASPKLEKYLRTTIAFANDLRHRASPNGKSFVKRVVRRIRMSLFHRENVRFYEWPAEHKQNGSLRTSLRPLDPMMLGAAAVQYGNDAASLPFLMRSAQRLRLGEGQGYVLLTPEEVPVHFCWAKDFEGFHVAELDRTLKAPRENAVMIFDCFTPSATRGHGFFAEAISQLAQELNSQGKSAWIFGAATNRASVSGIEKTGFQHRFTLGRRRILGFSHAVDSVPSVSSVRDESSMSVS